MSDVVETKADYPFDQCLADQMKRYGDEDTARKVCGAIKRDYGSKQVTEEEYKAIEADLKIAPKAKEAKTEVVNNYNLTVTESKEASLLSQLLSKFDSLIETFKAGARHSKPDQANVQSIHDASVDLGASCPMSVFKDAKGKWRWVLFSSSAYKDKDGEIVSTKAQENDIARMDASGDYGVLRWWHVGKPYTTKAADWKSYTAGPGINLGTCDYSAMQGRVRVESGTFDNDAVGEAFSKVANKQSVSIGFSHPDNEPIGGTFDNIHTFERSLLPEGINSNYLADVPVIMKENSNMDENKMKALKGILGEELADKVLAQATTSDKEAEAAGLKFKAKKVAEMTTEELSEFIATTVKGAQTEKAMTCAKCGGGLSTKDKFCSACGTKAMADPAEPDADDKSKKEVDTSVALKELDATLKAMSEKIEKQAAYLIEQDKAVKSLQGDLPRSLSHLRRTNADDNVVTDKSKIKEPAQKSNDASDFLDFAVTGSVNGNHKTPVG